MRAQIVGRVALGAALLLVAAGCRDAAAPPPPAPVATSTSASSAVATPSSATPSSVSSTTAAAVTPGSGTPTVGGPPAPAGGLLVPRGAGISAPGAALDRHDATAVGSAFAIASFAYDASMDTSPFDAQVRSAAFATPTYAASLRRPLANPGSAQFNDLSDHHGYTTVALSENHDDGRPPDTTTAAVRSWTANITGHAPDGWSAPMGSALLYVSLTRPSAGAVWQVAGVQIPEAH